MQMGLDSAWAPADTIWRLLPITSGTQLTHLPSYWIKKSTEDQRTQNAQPFACIEVTNKVKEGIEKREDPESKKNKVDCGRKGLGKQNIRGKNIGRHV